MVQVQQFCEEHAGPVARLTLQHDCRKLVADGQAMHAKKLAAERLVNQLLSVRCTCAFWQTLAVRATHTVWPTGMRIVLSSICIVRLVLTALRGASMAVMRNALCRLAMHVLETSTLVRLTRGSEHWWRRWLSSKLPLTPRRHASGASWQPLSPSSACFLCRLLAAARTTAPFL